MKPYTDPLYTIFEKHLYNFIIEEQSSEDFVRAVVHDYLESIRSQGTISVRTIEFLEQDLKEEVTEMLRKKTYGHYSLAQFRQACSRTPRSS